MGVFFRIVVRILVIAACLASAAVAYGRNEQQPRSIKDALADQSAGKIDPEISLYFGDNATAKVQKALSDVLVSRKANAFLRSDEAACRKAFLSALLTLQAAARAAGVNAVINIKSNYQRHETSSETEYICGSGGVVGGVVLRGTLAQVGK